MTTLQLIFYQAHEIARREMACDVGRQFYGSYRAAFADALRTIYSERKQDDAEIHRNANSPNIVSEQRLDADACT